MYRTFRDAAGAEWEAWEVPAPMLGEVCDPRLLDAAFRDGWLVFRCGDEKRRIACYPAEWATLDDDALAGLCAAAQPVRQRAHGHRST